MAAGSTYSTIATTTLASAAASYTFSSIPSTYTDLVLVCSNLTTSVNNTIYTQLNSDATTNYSGTYLYGTGAAAGSGRVSNVYGAFIGALTNISATEPTTIISNIQNYSNTTTYKTLLSRYSYAGSNVEADISMWRSTSAINSIKIYVGVGNSASPTGNLNAGTILTLYGITAA